LEKPLDLRAAQIIFFADGKKPEIRINSEIKAIASVKLKAGISKKKGDPIRANEVEGLNKIKLTDMEDPDCAHATLIRIINTWIIAFDFRYNKGLAQKHIDTAKQFFEATKFSFDRKHWSPCLDNLFSAAELSAKAELLMIPDPKFKKKTSHYGIKSRYNRFANLGNVELKYCKALNKLEGLRSRVRYLQGEVPISEKEIQSLLEDVKQMIADVTDRIQLEDKPLIYRFKLKKEKETVEVKTKKSKPKL
jgi:uncharacterized protein (UPF0332 family)